MSIFGLVKKLYSLDTLDTRFSNTSRTPPRAAGEKGIAEAKSSAQEATQASLPGVQPSKWRTPEFYFYYFCFLTIPLLMVKAVYDVSKGRSSRAYLDDVSC